MAKTLKEDLSDKLKKPGEILDSPKLKAQVAPQKTYRRRLPVFKATLILLITSFLALTFYIKINSFFVLDLPITKFIQSFQPIWFDYLMKFVSLMGNTIPGSILACLAALFLYYSLKLKKEAGLVLFSVLGSFIVGVFFKTLVSRPRPDPNIIHQVGKFINLDSFPSGHVLFYMGFYGFLIFLVYSRMKKTILRKIFLIVLLILLILIGLSRIYLGAHWFSDVLGAYLVGTVWLYFMVYLHNRLVD